MSYLVLCFPHDDSSAHKVCISYFSHMQLRLLSKYSD